MQNFKLQLRINNFEARLDLKGGRGLIDRECLTISRNFDTLLIVAIDNILSRNRIDRLSLKSLEIPTKLKDGTISAMILKTIKTGLEV